MNNKELINAGHALAKAISSDTPLIEIAKMVSNLATQLDVQIARSNQLSISLEAAENRIAELDAREIKPARGEVLVTVSGFTGCGKSAIAGEIEIAMKAIGVPVLWTDGDAEKRMTGADWLSAIEMYNPTVRIVEVNVPGPLIVDAKIHKGGAV